MNIPCKAGEQKYSMVLCTVAFSLLNSGEMNSETR